MKVRVFLNDSDDSEVLELAGIPRTGELIVRHEEGFQVEEVEHTPDEEVKVSVRANTKKGFAFA